MTNTVSTIYTALTSSFSGVFDGLIGIGVAVTAVSIIYVLIRRMLSHRAKA